MIISFTMVFEIEEPAITTGVSFFSKIYSSAIIKFSRLGLGALVISMGGLVMMIMALYTENRKTTTRNDMTILFFLKLEINKSIFISLIKKDEEQKQSV